MNRQVCTIALLASLALSAAADDEKQTREQPNRAGATDAKAEGLPDAATGFGGAVVGRLVRKDVEKGTLVLSVDAVPRVWRNNTARNPKSIIGRDVEIEGVSGKFLDVLLLVRPGETLELAARHNGGDRLTFPGEMFRKVAPYKPEDYPVLPEGFRGFQGAVVGKVVQKSVESLQLIVQVEKVIDVWKNNKAKQADSIAGRRIMLAGFWKRKDAFHGFKVGDRIEVGLQHIGIQSDHLTVAEFIRKAGTEAEPAPAAADQDFPAGIHGFNGMLVGRLVTKDVEKGTFVVTVDRVPRVWRNSKAQNPKSIVGKNVEIDGVFGKWLDVLLLVKTGETLEFESRHDSGRRLTFPGELLRKVSAVKPGDYPELPEAFRGFDGSVVGRIVKKDAETMELIVQIASVQKTSDKNRAKNPNSIVGKQAMLAGFWRRKDDYHSLKVGDTIECALQHIQTRSDHLTVGEFAHRPQEE